MRPSIGWLIFVAVLVGLAYVMVFSGRDGPPPDLLPLEVTTADFNESSSCYPLSSLLAANRLDGSDSNIDTGWTQRVKDEWTLRVERGRSWSAYSFQREADRLLPVRVAFSDDLPQLNTREAIAALIVPAVSQDKPRMANCEAAPARPSGQ
jgi:hypothetical protein